MSKRKQPEDPTTESYACVEEATSTLQVEEPQESNVVEGWVIGSEPADNRRRLQLQLWTPNWNVKTVGRLKPFGSC